MDCEKFESTLLDELYDELDEVTSAAAKRHVAGCARCAALYSGLKATKRLAVLPMVDPPADLEERILAAAREAQKVVPIRGRVSRAVSWAGAWAMRPQTAMAALFLLCTGTGVLFMKGHAAKPASSVLTVSEEGEPVARAVTTPPVARPMEPQAESKAAAAAPAPVAVAPMATSTASPPSAASAYAMNDDSKGGVVDGLLARGGGSPGRAAPAAAPKALGGIAAADQASGDGQYRRERADEGARNASNGAGAPAQQGYAAPNAPPPMPPSKAAAKPSAKKDAPYAQAPGPQGPQGQGQGGGGQVLDLAPATPSSLSPFDSAMSAYNAGSYANARDQFHVLAASGDLTAALWEARSEREANDCSTAVTLFDAVIRNGPATRASYDAHLDAGRCYRLLGSWDAARQRLSPLLTVPSHMAIAKQELDVMSAKAAGHAASRSAPNATQAAPPKQPTQQQKAAPNSDMQNSY